jgi:type IV pilus assembly protein PilE
MIRRQLGVTLIELLIVIVIISILAAIAIPAYSKYVQRARRADAINAIQLAAAAEEKYYFQNNHYTDSATLGITASAEGYYTIGIVNTGGDTQTYVITATATGAQAADTNCATYTLSNTGAKTPLPSSDTYACWHR